jgi:hypothetical protein
VRAKVRRFALQRVNWKVTFQGPKDLANGIVLSSGQKQVANHTPKVAGTGMIPEAGLPVPVTVGTMPELRKCTGDKDGTVLTTSTPWTYQEHNVLPAFQ